MIGLGARGGGDLVVTVVVMLQCGSDSGSHSNGVRGGDNGSHSNGVRGGDSGDHSNGVIGGDSGGHSNGVRGGDLMTAVVHVGGVFLVLQTSQFDELTD